MKDKILTALFIIVIYSLSIGSILVKDKTFSENENKVLKSLPKFSTSSLISGRYTKNYEEYVQDQFIGRDTFIGLKTLTELSIGRKENKGAYFGSDGYLIEKHENMKTDLLYENIESIDKFSKMINEYNEENKKDIKVYMTLVPTTGEVMSDKLPKYAFKNDEEEIYKEIKDKTNDIIHKDVFKVLKDNKDDYIYYKTDHHYTTKGAYLVYKELGEALGYKPLSENDFKIEEASDKFLGTIYSKASLYNIKPDTINLYKTDTKYKVTYNRGEFVRNTLYDLTALNKKDKYSVFLNGNNAVVEIENMSIEGDNELVVVKDSFAHSLLPFLAEHYKKIHVLDLRYLNSDVFNEVISRSEDQILILYNTANFSTDNNIYKLTK